MSLKRISPPRSQIWDRASSYGAGRNHGNVTSPTKALVAVSICLGLAVVWFMVTQGSGWRLICLRYPLPVENDPMEHPVSVLQVHGNRLTLEDGRSLTLSAPFSEQHIEHVKEILADSRNQVQLERLETPHHPNEFLVYVRSPSRRLACGTPYAGYRVTIPVFPVRIPRYDLTPKWLARPATDRFGLGQR